ncbi:hypothetical protein WAE58_04295 [Pedobacter panaciterrae]|uniref:Restriction endonuclease n=1 Tax=Pedobacter panaciterrae TaxID=363849 RepID=A0ABU8NHB7_9SPHI
MQKPNITRTLGQIHFEDLEPHRFEDLVRQLIYDYKDWQSIEATGRGGADDGYDIRAYEKNSVLQQETDEDTAEPIPPMEGRRWMIQCKREQEIASAKVKKIISDGVNPADPPYGYILAASANISKKTYDTFRDELRGAGVMEFYLWGKAELEDQLLLPKNDRILFTFFGISLFNKRQKKTTEIRSIITVKNKLVGLLGNVNSISGEILVRDVNDEFYPNYDQIPDFDLRPSWERIRVDEAHPKGIVCDIHEYFAYIDKGKKEYDFTVSHDFLTNKVLDHIQENERHRQQMRIRNHWELLARHHQGYVKIKGLLRFRDILLVDPKGDKYNEMPHVFIDYNGRSGPFDNEHLFGDQLHDLFRLSDYQRIKVFPESFGNVIFGITHNDRKIELDPSLVTHYKQSNSIPALYSIDGKYQHLNSRDLVIIDDPNDKSQPYWMVTAIYTSTVSKHLEEHPGYYQLKGFVEAQLQMEIKDTKKINVYELRRVFDYELASANSNQSEEE